LLDDILSRSSKDLPTEELVRCVMTHLGTSHSVSWHSYLW